MSGRSSQINNMSVKETLAESRNTTSADKDALKDGALLLGGKIGYTIANIS